MEKTANRTEMERLSSVRLSSVRQPAWETTDYFRSMQRSSSSKAQAEPMHATPTTLLSANVNAGNFPLLIGPLQKMWRSGLTGLPIRWVSYFLVNNPRLHKQGQSNTMKNPKNYYRLLCVCACGAAIACVSSAGGKLLALRPLTTHRKGNVLQSGI